MSRKQFIINKFCWISYLVECDSNNWAALWEVFSEGIWGTETTRRRGDEEACQVITMRLLNNCCISSFLITAHFHIVLLWIQPIQFLCSCVRWPYQQLLVHFTFLNRDIVSWFASVWNLGQCSLVCAFQVKTTSKFNPRWEGD